MSDSEFEEIAREYETLRDVGPDDRFWLSSVARLIAEVKLLRKSRARFLDEIEAGKHAAEWEPMR